MVIKEKIILNLLKNKSLKMDEIAKRLGLKKRNMENLRKVLLDLSRRGEITYLGRGRFCGREEKNRITGFIRKVGKVYFLESDEKTKNSYVIVSAPQNLPQDALGVGERKKNGCEIIRVFPSLSTIEDIREFVILKYGLKDRFGHKVEKEIKKIESELRFDGRLDLRHLRHVTIDGENAKDFDDAVSIERREGGYRLYVSIADVGYYVRKKSALDEEAKRRGMSVYFPDSVIPMLPKVLSDDLCSLKPKRDRLSFSVIIDLDKKGNVKSASFKKSVIRSVKRLTYEEVERAIIEKDKDERKRLRGLIKDLELMKELTEKLLEIREERGSLDFDLPEPEIILDMEGDVKDILRSKRLFSHRIIEEFMILANKNVAEFFVKNKIPALFRVHEEPETTKLKSFERFLKSLKIGTYEHERGIRRLQRILEEVKGKPYEFIVNRVLLRSMKQARYSVENKGHYGLGLPNYLHFTSPIRRYPDLVCHRILDFFLSVRKIPYTYEELEYLGEYLSERERVIMEAEREIEDRIRILFMKECMGEEYLGIITHVAQFGFFVELLDIFVEGLVLFSDLTDDYYEAKGDGTSFLGKKRKSVFRLGDIVKVKVISADVERKTLRFLLLGRA